MQFNLSAESVKIIIDALKLEVEELNKSLKIVAGLDKYETMLKGRISDTKYLIEMFEEELNNGNDH